MAYSFKKPEKSAEKNLRRVALSQIDKAIAEAGDDGLPRAERVHQVRKRGKKLRGLVRLVRPAFPGYAAENAAFRDIARTLAPARDAAVLQQAYDAVMDAYAETVDRPPFAPIRAELTRRRNALDEEAIETALYDARSALSEAAVRAEAWELDESGFDAVAGGLKKTAKRARARMADAEADPTPAALHAWRKRVKYHRYHMRLLAPLWPAAFEARETAADRLGDLLGAHHDLAVLAETLRAGPDAFGDAKTLSAFLALVARRQKELEAEAFPLGRRLFAEKPRHLATRTEALWDIWKREAKADDKLKAAA